ncbi:unnamed protein product, partial [Rotaria sp. Silwood2]
MSLLTYANTCYTVVIIVFLPPVDVADMTSVDGWLAIAGDLDDDDDDFVAAAARFST